MNNKNYWLLSLLCMLMLMSTVGMAQQREVTVSKEQVVIDSRYDSLIDQSLIDYITPFKHNVDSLMRPVVGQTARILNADRPESPLSNMLSDMLVWIADSVYGENVDFGVYNMGGIRASFPKGDITLGDVLDVAPFENKPCFLTLSAASVDSLFREMASVGGECISKEVRLCITPDGKLLSATVDGQPVGTKKEYRVVTINYLAQGNDKMIAFKNKYNVVSPSDDKDNMREVIANFFRAMAARGIVVDGQCDGRITIKTE